MRKSPPIFVMFSFHQTNQKFERRLLIIPNRCHLSFNIVTYLVVDFVVVVLVAVVFDCDD